MMKLTSSVLLLIFSLSPIARADTLPPGSLPNQRLTPGDTLQVVRADVCVKGYSKKVRNVPADVKRKVYQAYGIFHHGRNEYEVDHLVPLSIGGSNSVKNLWPEPRHGIVWNAGVKDGLENKLHHLVCEQKVDLKTAQVEFANDWIAAYKKYFHTNEPTTSTHMVKKRRRRLHKVGVL